MVRTFLHASHAFARETQHYCCAVCTHLWTICSLCKYSSAEPISHANSLIEFSPNLTSWPKWYLRSPPNNKSETMNRSSSSETQCRYLPVSYWYSTGFLICRRHSSFRRNIVIILFPITYATKYSSAIITTRKTPEVYLMIEYRKCDKSFLTNYNNIKLVYPCYHG